MMVEAVVALGTGITAHSLALTAFGADSLIELAASATLLWRLTVEAWGYGAAKVEAAETVSSWVVGLALLALSAYILAVAAYDLWTRTGAQNSALGLALAIASGAPMPWLSRMKRLIGGKIGSAALRADGSCSIVCAYMAWILIAGLALTAFWGWWWLNPLAGLALVWFVAHEGIEAIQIARGADDACEGG